MYAQYIIFIKVIFKSLFVLFSEKLIFHPLLYMSPLKIVYSKINNDRNELTLSFCVEQVFFTNQSVLLIIFLLNLSEIIVQDASVQQ